MENEIKEIVQVASAWTPEIIVNLIRGVIWPFTVLLLGWRFRGGISNALSNFFSKNTVTELSASPTGVTAKFRAAQQSAEVIEPKNPQSAIIPAGADFESIQNRHSEDRTEYSSKLFSSIKQHIDALGIDDEQKINLLETEASLLQSALRYFEINKVLFRSQFDLFSDYFFENEYVSIDDIKKHFSMVSLNNPEGLAGWDYAKYMAFPISAGIVQSSPNGYKLTKLGTSYVQFMRKNLQLIDELAKL